MGVAEQTVTKSTVAGVYFLRLRACASRTAGIPLILRQTGGHRPPLQSANAPQL